MRGRSHRTPKHRAVFLAALAETGSVTRAFEAAKFPRQCAYDWRRDDADFAAAWTTPSSSAPTRLKTRLCVAPRKAWRGRSIIMATASIHGARSFRRAADVLVEGSAA